MKRVERIRSVIASESDTTNWGPLQQKFPLKGIKTAHIRSWDWTTIAVLERAMVSAAGKLL
jgi:hypothetical protein